MKTIEEQIKSAGDKAGLTNEERSRIRARLNVEIAMSAQARFAPRQSIWMYLFKRHSFSMSLAVVLFFGSGLSVLAEHATPEDFLYPFKTGVNEEILGLFVSSPYKEAELSVKLAERRLAEAEYLALQESVPTTVRDRHNTALEKQIDKADSFVRQLDGANTKTTQGFAADTGSLSTGEDVTMMMTAPNEAPLADDISAMSKATGTVENAANDKALLKETIYELRKRIRDLKSGKYGSQSLLMEFRLIQLQKEILDGSGIAELVRQEIDGLRKEIEILEVGGTQSELSDPNPISPIRDSNIDQVTNVIEQGI